MTAPVNTGARQLVLSKRVPGRGYQARRIGPLMPADAAAVLFGRLVDYTISPAIAPNVMRTCETLEGTRMCGTVTGGGFLRVQRPGDPLPGSEL